MFDPITALNTPNSALFWGRQSWLDAPGVVLAHSPARVETTDDPAAVPALLAAVEDASSDGLWVAFYVSYEAGAAYELANHPPGDLVPLAWMAAYDPANVHLLPPDALPMLPPPEGLQDVQPTLNVSRETYGDALDRIHDYIACGDTYQVNYTCHARFHLDCDPLAYFLTMVRSHPVPYAAWLNLGDRQVLSISPELFLQRRGDVISSRPMKGTRKRGRTPAEDAALADDLTTSLKDRAENLMILDMERNDLGRVARIGTVRVPHMFTAEKYRSVWQMTSTVEAELLPGVTLPDLFAATFPGASITGAPKRRTMEIIRELEPEPRGLYCGALGLHQPGTDFTCGLPIRTLIHHSGDFDLGIGAGILWDSLTGSEYEETLLKARFAFRSQPDLKLFETLLLQADGQYAYLEAHLSRLQSSADYFDFPCDTDALRQLLQAKAASLAVGVSSEVRVSSEVEGASEVGGATGPDAVPPLVVRLDLTADGHATIATRPLPPPPAAPVRVLLWPIPTDSANALLYHKTNQRHFYDQARAAALAQGYFEVLFTNENGAVTEGAITNLFLRTESGWKTPPIADGLLPGIWREEFMKETGAEEVSLTPEDMRPAKEIVIGNSVRGAVRVDEVLGVREESIYPGW